MIKNPALIIALSVVSFFCFDTAVFKSGLYARISAPYSSDNTAGYNVYFESARPADPDKDVLVFGSSRVGDSFSILDYRIQHPNSPLNFIDMTIPGSSEAVWYEELRSVDPNNDRYRAIVLPMFSTYRSQGRGYAPSMINTISAVQAALTTDGWRSLYQSAQTDEQRKKVAFAFFLRAQGYAPDFQDMLLHPFKRYESLKDAYKKRSDWDLDRRRIRWEKNGSLASMREWRSLVGLGYDSEKGIITAWPEGMTEGAKRYYTSFVPKVPQPELDLRAQSMTNYTSYWDQKIIEKYKGTKTKIIFFQLPICPVPFDVLKINESVPDMREVLHGHENVEFAPEDMLTSLQTMENFSDPDHLSMEGRLLFTQILGKYLTETLTR